MDDSPDDDTFVQNFEVTGTGIEPTQAAQLLCSYLERPTEAEFVDWPAGPGDAICHLVIDAFVADSEDVSRLAARAEVDLAHFSCSLGQLEMTVFDAAGGFSHLMAGRVELERPRESEEARPWCARLALGEDVHPSLLQPPSDFELSLTPSPV